mmetsp:Transcript_12702/g.19138  ORF Transcript_12702/g.19138 Transcript_12702/m.19138 type:complete len:245 (+) Transcript_12702:121-855(+)|eukprot:CAMPEP_0185029490 /NCGR_PEP_ID=MMETSP1103-20130426/15820_1 /TAXON_ID=36769 /ORGANISM="Paraphysomonas bandaiensis, Strain Caron Lab Isolate" /LENGTH=244 /DNA_ID=CAMNT_0027564257 /DNA_START=93 /DNA_END=827 /DNA_ORIENTATION=+
MNQEATLRSKHNQLANHWSNVVDFRVNPKISDNTYKHHIARLMHTYTNHKTTVDHKRPISSGQRTSALTELYGIDGLVSSRRRDEELRRREKEWESRVVITENMPATQRKQRAKAEAEAFLSQRRVPADDGTADGISMKRPHSARPKSSRSKTRSQRKHSSSPEVHECRRVDIEGISENDLIANGLYYLTEKQLELYDEFVTMLSEFDHTDMINILEDTLCDAKKKTGLSKYGGTVLPESEGPT